MKPFDWQKLDTILQLAASKVMCSEFLNVSEDTIERRIKKKYGLTFNQYKERKLTNTKIKLIQKALTEATSGNSTMLIFCLKNLCGWADKTEVEISDHNAEFVNE